MNGKKILLIVLFFALIAIGVIGITKCDGAEASANDTAAVAQEVREEETVENKTGADNHYADLDHALMPPGSTSIEKAYEGFRLAYNPDTKNPDWVAWELLGSETMGTVSRSNKFWHDDSLAGCAYNTDYSRSGFDRGHMCPAADQKWSEKAMNDCFVMANMCPQDHALNTGAWNTLENKERAWAKRDSAIVIVAGPIFEKNDTATIGASKVRMPGAFYKVIIAPYVEQPRGIAFIFPNMSSPGNMEQYVTTIDDVEKLTGLDFFHNLPDDIEDRVESVSSFREWNRRK